MLTEHEQIRLRPALLRYCTRLLGDPHQAEDLVQETLLIALRKPPVADPAAYLFGIARRLRRRVGATDFLADDDTLRGGDDPLDALLVRERGAVLEAAFAQLDPDARHLLLARYIDGTPVYVLAEEQGCTPTALSLRLRRARAALERVLARTQPDVARVHGLIAPEQAQGWQETAIYCLRCGLRRLMGRLTPEHFALRCPDCDSGRAGLAGLATRAQPLPAEAVLAGAKGFRIGLRRVNAWWQRYLADGFARGQAACVHCGALATTRRHWPGGAPGFVSECAHCHQSFYVALPGLLIHSDEGQHFWSEHGRLRFAGQESLQYQGRPAQRVWFEARTSAARLEAIYATDDLTRLA